MVAAGDPLSGLLIAIGSVAAFMSGLVGVGGAVLLIPMLLYLQPVFGLAAIPIKMVTRMTIVQVAGGALSAGLSHLHAKRVDRSLLIVVGGSLATFSLTGALFSSLVPGIVLEAVFATVALVAAGRARVRPSAPSAERPRIATGATTHGSGGSGDAHRAVSLHPVAPGVGQSVVTARPIDSFHWPSSTNRRKASSTGPRRLSRA